METADYMTKLYIRKCYHNFLHVYMPNKQKKSTKVLPPLVVPISGLAHGLTQEAILG